ncbi:hypothetical protein [Paenibacillus xylanivorans]|uniref:Uncharacterized protein n=1 Tax=Paenibacillus xylanivorans TaxID=1705561 RepID=A0A0M9BRF9_9BACL|nr:hypothetical protein [Paenibacillus xylanivorans]KOY16826.1 hypothetical protein AMS66_08070 [Paenibacillus xylanivorans]
MEIYFEEDNELFSWEAESKGYRYDIYVKIDKELFRVAAYDLARITQDFNDEVIHNGFYRMDANLILLKEVTKDEIISTVTRLYQEDFFGELKPLDEGNVTSLNLIKIN